MQRSHCENENVQFVQELAEVDGPFESPININFRDLTKLELPPLVWNRAEVSPKKMKITNTGHTVIISGKWKCERPYLTGGPLSGKYVFSQIHFHWGQDNCRGSEHQVCGEGFPLEMHVAHFKTEYLTQECALREKDGMVVLVYLFKLQDEPNASLKKILNLLPSVKQASTSHAVDPKPILSLCNPFTEDYFMYWGSVVTSTCAHILLWIISREPFGISREQVNEFRKILDTSHQPICRNSRDTQPLHRRNVFHVNASKHLDDALLPIKKVLGCYCKGSDENVSSKSQNNGCTCQSSMQNQEDVEGNIVEHAKGRHLSDTRGQNTVHWKAGLASGCFKNPSIFVHTATIHSVPMLVKRFDSEPVRTLCCFDELKQTKSEGDAQANSISKGCCFLSTKEVGRMKSRGEKRKIREKKKPFNSVRAFSQLMDSLEAIKNQTFKKLKEIESINQEIKGMKPFCHDSEDKRWLRRIEKIISRQKRFTLKSSQGCFSELKKLARECNFDKFFDGKALPVGDHDQKMMWLNDNELGNGALPYTYNYMKGEEIPRMEMTTSKNFTITKAVKFSAKAQRLIQSFFEDIKETDDLQETVKKDLDIKKLSSFCNKQAGDSVSLSTVNKGYITQRMFTLGNLGDRFFTEVSTDSFEMNENDWSDKRQSSEIVIVNQDNSPEKITPHWEGKQTTKNAQPAVKQETKNRESVLVHQNDVCIEVIESAGEEQYADIELGKANMEDSESPTGDDKVYKSYPVRESKKQPFRAMRKEFSGLMGHPPSKRLQKVTMLGLHPSSSDLSTESMGTHRAVSGRIRKRQSRKDVWEQKPSLLFPKASSKELYEKNYKKQKLKNVNLEGYSLQKRKLRKKESFRIERKTDKTSWDLTSTSKEEAQALAGKSKWKRLTKAKLRLEMKKSIESTSGSEIEGCLISPERKKLKLEGKKGKLRKENKLQTESKDSHSEGTESGALSRSSKFNENAPTNSEIFQVTEIKSRVSKSAGSQPRTPLRFSFSQKSTNESIATSGASTKKITADSTDSQSSQLRKQDFSTSKEKESPNQIKIELLKKDFQTFSGSKLAMRNRSLDNLTTAPVRSTKISHRMFVETIDDRRQNFELRKMIESPTKTEERLKFTTIKDLCRETSYETGKKSSDDRSKESPDDYSGKLEKADKQTMGNTGYNVRFLTATPLPIDDELLPKTHPQEGEGKAAPVKHSEAAKYHFLESGLQEVKEGFPELSLQKNSNSTKLDSKGDTDSLFPSSEDPLSVDKKDRQVSISYSSLTKNAESRHHSAETLISHKKTTKRKRKKRPNCRQRSSKHYMRKNSSVLRKPNKVDSKQQHLLNLADEEQIKIISDNVAKYLKQKLVEKSTEPGGEKNCSLKDIKEVVYNNLVASQKKAKEVPMQELRTAPGIETKPNEVHVVKATGKTEKPDKKQQESKDESLVVKPVAEPKKEKPASTSPKPVHNFIKRNKQMAGKYKRVVPQTEKKVELKKKEEDKPKQVISKVKIKAHNKKKDKGSPQKQKDDQPKSTSEGISSQKNQKQLEKPKKASRVKTPKTPKKPDSESQETKTSVSPKPQPEPKPVAEPTESQEQPNQLVQCESSTNDALQSPIALRKIPQPKKRLVPAYMVTSYLPAPIEIVQSQKRKMNKYFLTMNDTQLDNYLPEVLHETKNRKSERAKNDSAFEKELEYLIRLQLCLNDEITSNIENSMNYVKTFISPDYPPPYFDSGNKGVVLVEMKDGDHSSSGSDVTDDISKYLGKKSSASDIFGRNKRVTHKKMPKESGDSDILGPIVLQESQSNSDSSYDCKISITLNPNAKESEGEIQTCDTLTYLGENSNSQTTIFLDGSSSQSTVTKPHRKKRKEKEISMEMKQKLLEILEGEIKREIGFGTGGASEMSSEGLTIKWEDWDGNNRSQSTDSSSENTEILTQISETMRQYLSVFKERRLGEIITESSDKESRDDE